MFSKNLLNYITIFFTLSSCIADENFNFYELKFSISNNDISKIGYKYFEDDQALGPISIFIKGENIFLVDNFHGNIKLIDISKGKIIKYSKKLSNSRNPWPRDVTVFNGNVYVSSDLDSMYILDYNLDKIKTIYTLINSPKYFIKNNNNLAIYYETENKLAYLSKKNEISKFKDTDDSAPYYFAHGKGYSLEKKEDDNILITKYFRLKLKKNIPDIFDKFNAINIDYNERTLVYFDVNEHFFTLYIYQKK